MEGKKDIAKRTLATNLWVLSSIGLLKDCKLRTVWSSLSSSNKKIPQIQRCCRSSSPLTNIYNMILEINQENITASYTITDWLQQTAFVKLITVTMCGNSRPIRNAFSQKNYAVQVFFHSLQVNACKPGVLRTSDEPFLLATLIRVCKTAPKQFWLLHCYSWAWICSAYGLAL